jgi:hypothetical protein
MKLVCLENRRYAMLPVDPGWTRTWKVRLRKFLYLLEDTGSHRQVSQVVKEVNPWFGKGAPERWANG